MKNLFKKNKNILITAGPTWVAIDKVRIITTIFGGALGYAIANKAYKEGFNVTLLMGPGRSQKMKCNQKLKIKKFRYFAEFKKIFISEVKSKRYSVIIHSAAVPDYEPKRIFSGKISSGKSSLTLKLKPTVKLVDIIKRLDPKVLLIKFKLEVNKSQNELIRIAYRSMQTSHADLIVANDFNTIIKNHKAFIITPERNIYSIVGKSKIANKLVHIIQKILRLK